MNLIPTAEPATIFAFWCVVGGLASVAFVLHLLRDERDERDEIEDLRRFVEAQTRLRGRPYCPVCGYTRWALRERGIELPPPGPHDCPEAPPV